MIEQFGEAMADRVMGEELAWAKKERAKHPFNHGSAAFTPRITMIGPGGQVALVPLPGWENEQEKRSIMYGTAIVLRSIEAQAAFITHDMSFIDLAQVGRALKFAPVDYTDPASVERGEQEWLEYRRVHLKDNMTNLPRHLWSDAIMVGMKSEKHGLRSVRNLYIDDGHGRCLFEDASPVDNVLSVNVIPDWWKIPDDAPELVHARRNIQVFYKKER